MREQREHDARQHAARDRQPEAPAQHRAVDRDRSAPCGSPASGGARLLGSSRLSSRPVLTALFRRFLGSKSGGGMVDGGGVSPPERVRGRGVVVGRRGSGMSARSALDALDQRLVDLAQVAMAWPASPASTSWPCARRRRPRARPSTRPGSRARRRSRRGRPRRGRSRAVPSAGARGPRDRESPRVDPPGRPPRARPTPWRSRAGRGPGPRGPYWPSRRRPAASRSRRCPPDRCLRDRTCPAFSARARVETWIWRFSALPRRERQGRRRVTLRGGSSAS